jgi:hypothetical protein
MTCAIPVIQNSRASTEVILLTRNILLCFEPQYFDFCCKADEQIDSIELQNTKDYPREIDQMDTWKQKNGFGSLQRFVFSGAIRFFLNGYHCFLYACCPK